MMLSPHERTLGCLKEMQVFDLNTVIGRIEQMCQDILMNKDPKIAFMGAVKAKQKSSGSSMLCFSESSIAEKVLSVLP